MQRSAKLSCHIHMNFKTLFIAIITLMITGSSCTKEIREVNGTVKDFTGFDGCGIMIVLDSGEKLEIVSLPNNITLIPGRRAALRYRIVYKASVCMSGVTAEITSLRYL